MSSLIATFSYAAGILVLLSLDRDWKARVSPALWIPVLWLCIGGSRMVSDWLDMAPPSSVEQILEGSPLDRNILMGLMAIGVLVLLRRGPQVRAVLRANWPLLLFFLYCGLSSVWSDYPDVAFKRWIKACGDVVMVLIVLTDPGRIEAIKRLFARLGFLLIPTSILLIKYYPDLGRGYENLTWEVVFIGVTTNKNMLGMICMICGLGATWRLLDMYGDTQDKHRTGPFIAQGILLAMVLWLFVQANSMTALSCFLLANAVMFATSVRGIARRPWLVHVIVIVALSVSAAILFSGIGEDTLRAVGRDPTLTGRTQIWELVLGFAGNPLFGTGFESFWLGERLQRIWDVVWWHPNESHNGYIEIYLTLGWIGLALLAVTMVSGYRNIVASVRQQMAAGSFRLGYFVALVAYNFTEAAIRGFQPLWILFLLAIIAVPDAPAPKISRRMAASGAGSPVLGCESLTQTNAGGSRTQ